jgi:hypothetical protein
MSVFIFGTARDVASHLPGVLDNIERIGSLFCSWHAAIVESHSVDTTWDVLNQWKAGRPNIDLLQMSLPQSLKTERLGEARNRLLMFLRPEDTYLIVLDMDNVNSHPIDLDGIRSSLMYTSDWAAIGCNSAPPHGLYDIMALRGFMGLNENCWDLYRSAIARGMPDGQAKNQFVYRYMVQIPKTYGFIEVDSCFNGLMIYKTSYIHSCCHYDGRNDICEHVSFHQCIKSHGGRIFINSRMTNGM